MAKICPMRMMSLSMDFDIEKDADAIKCIEDKCGFWSSCEKCAITVVSEFDIEVSRAANELTGLKMEVCSLKIELKNIVNAIRAPITETTSVVKSY